jgi:hypothetical protein
METLQNKFDNDDNDYLRQKIPNSISSKELYCEKDLGVNNYFYLLIIKSSDNSICYSI